MTVPLYFPPASIETHRGFCSKHTPWVSLLRNCSRRRAHFFWGGNLEKSWSQVESPSIMGKVSPVEFLSLLRKPHLGNRVESIHSWVNFGLKSFQRVFWVAFIPFLFSQSPCSSIIEFKKCFWILGTGFHISEIFYTGSFTNVVWKKYLSERKFSAF